VDLVHYTLNFYLAKVLFKLRVAPSTYLALPVAPLPRRAVVISWPKLGLRILTAVWNSFLPFSSRQWITTQAQKKQLLAYCLHWSFHASNRVDSPVICIILGLKIDRAHFQPSLLVTNMCVSCASLYLQWLST
jgi:hypothetical protein